MTLRHLTDALNDTCAIERGSIFEPVTLSGVACLVCPPQNARDDALLRLLIMDADRLAGGLWRAAVRGDAAVGCPERADGTCVE